MQLKNPSGSHETPGRPLGFQPHDTIHRADKVSLNKTGSDLPDLSAFIATFLFTISAAKAGKELHGAR